MNEIKVIWGRAKLLSFSPHSHLRVKLMTLISELENRNVDSAWCFGNSYEKPLFSALFHFPHLLGQ